MLFLSVGRGVAPLEGDAETYLGARPAVLGERSTGVPPEAQLRRGWRRRPRMEVKPRLCERSAETSMGASFAVARKGLTGLPAERTASALRG